MKMVASAVSRFGPFSIVLAALIFGVDLARGAHLRQWADIAPDELGRMGLDLVVFAGLGGVIGTALLAVLLLPVAAGKRSEAPTDDESPDDPLVALATAVLGPSGTRWTSTAAIALLYVVFVALASWPLVGLLQPYSEVPVRVAVTAAAGLGMIVLAPLYRLVVARRPGWAARRGWLVAGVVGIIYAVIADPMSIAARYTLWPMLLVLLMAVALLALVVLAELNPRLRQGVERASLGFAAATVIAAMVVLPSYEADTARHARLMDGAVLVYPMLQVLRLPLDLDGDGFAGALAGGDCDEGNGDVDPFEPEVVGNGVDDNCFGGDLDEVSPVTKGPPMGRLPAGTPRPNIFLISVDTLRADHVGRRIGGHPLTPNLDRLAADSAVMTRAYAPATHTLESLTGIMTGEYAGDWHQHGLFFGTEPTLAELLGGAGWHREAVMTLTRMTHTYVRGFERIDNELGLVNQAKWVTTSEQTTDRSLAALDRLVDKHKPFVLWTHYFDPHGPYVDHEGLPDWLPRGGDAATYAREVYATDRAIGRLLDELRRRGLYDSSIIVFFSDHGEALGEEGVTWHVHAATEEILRIPIMIRAPGLAAGRYDAPVSGIDLLPTLTEYLGFESLSPRAGESLVDYIEGGPAPRRAVFAETSIMEPIFWVAVDGAHKLVFDARRISYQLYDLQSDPAELHNLVEERPHLFEQMRDRLGRWRDRTFNTAKLERKAATFESRRPVEPPRVIGKSVSDVDGAPIQPAR